MKKIIARILVIGVVLNCLVVLPAFASDVINATYTDIRFELEGNGGSDLTNPCWKTEIGYAKLSDTSIVREQSGVGANIEIINWKTGQTACDVIGIKSYQTSFNGSYPYYDNNGYGEIDGYYYLRMTTNGGSSYYKMTVRGTFTP